jgi:hypothetical protein
MGEEEPGAPMSSTDGILVVSAEAAQKICKLLRNPEIFRAGLKTKALSP